MRTKFKAWAQPFLDEHLEIQCSVEDLNSYPRYYLEIGSGKGQFLCAMALKYPTKLFVGIERNVTCAGITAKKIVENQLKNAKLMFVDAEKALPLIKDNSVETLFLNFSDPWPKKRHEKKRLTSEKFLKEYYRILKEKGRLIFKTDNEQLFNFSLEMIENSLFELILADPNYDGLDSFDDMSEYERNFRQQNLPIYRIILEKL